MKSYKDELIDNFDTNTSPKSEILKEVSRAIKSDSYYLIKLIEKDKSFPSEYHAEIIYIQTHRLPELKRLKQILMN